MNASSLPTLPANSIGYQYLKWVSLLMVGFTPFVTILPIYIYSQSPSWQLLCFFTAGMVYGVGGWLSYRQAANNNHYIALRVITTFYWFAPGLGCFFLSEMPLLMLTAAIYHIILFITLYPERLPFRNILIHLGIYLSLCFTAIFLDFSVAIPKWGFWIIGGTVIASDIAYSIPFFLNFKQIQLAGKILVVQIQLTLIGFTAFAFIANIPEELHMILLTIEGVIWLTTVWVLRYLTTPLIQLTENAEMIKQGDFSRRTKIEMNDEVGQLGIAFNQMVEQLYNTLNGLESIVASRTRDLNVASQVSRDITRELNLENLLPNLVEKTRVAFNLYAVSLFLFNPQTQELLFEAGSGASGEHMKGQAKAFHISAQPSLVSKSAREQKAEIVNDTSRSDSHFFNPLLPNTRAEAVFPMVVGEDLVGVLDLQSEYPNRFAESDIQIFSTLAEQIAIAIRNAQLYRNQEKVAEELKRTDLMKSQFLASMSHELRTPMNAIINLVDMVASEMIGAINEEQKTFLNQSMQSSRHLLHLINDVLDISKIQAGQLTLYIEQDVNIYEEIDTVTTIISPLISESVEFIQHIDPDISLIEADRRRIRQILLNLLSNAAKFTEQGIISLIIEKQSTQLLFAVKDTGPGIPITAQTIIFEPFVQTEDGRKRVEGTGLGLPISKKLVEAHGGRLWVESQLGEGTAFYFTLPYLMEESKSQI